MIREFLKKASKVRVETGVEDPEFLEDIATKINRATPD